LKKCVCIGVTSNTRKEGEAIKRNFEDLIKENATWLLRYIKSKISNKSLCEDMLQEIMLKAYKAYDDYIENGTFKSWLLRIASNYLNNYYSRNLVECLSLDYEDEEFDSLYGYLSSDELSPEEKLIHDELISSVMLQISKLPEKQRQMIAYRYFYDMSIEEISTKMNIPKGTIKSTTHYAIEALKKHFNVDTKGEKIMECKEFYKYLFIYANGTIQPNHKKLVEEHIKSCTKCKDVVVALQKLIPTMVFAQEDEMTYFSISFPELKLAFTGIRYEVENFELCEKALEEWGGNIPDDENNMSSGYTKNCEILGVFDNEGNEIKMKICQETETHYRTKPTYMKKVYRYMWNYCAFLNKVAGGYIRSSKEAPNLYYGSFNNSLGGNAKSALYQAITKDAENIRIKRGNGVIDCDTYKFAYVDRYVTDEETMRLEYSFLLNK